MKFHGHVFSHDGLKTDREKGKAIVVFTSFPFLLTLLRQNWYTDRICWNKRRAGVVALATSTLLTEIKGASLG